MLQHQMDRLRFQYEYGGKTLEQIAYEERIALSDLKRYAVDHDWKVFFDHNVEIKKADSETIYSDVRKLLTIEVAKRAVAKWYQLTSIEDALLEKIRSAVSNFEPDAYNSPALELARLVSAFKQLRDTNQIYTESINTPAQIERHRDGISSESCDEIAAKVRLAIRDIDASIPKPIYEGGLDEE